MLIDACGGDAGNIQRTCPRGCYCAELRVLLPQVVQDAFVLRLIKAPQIWNELFKADGLQNTLRERILVVLAIAIIS